MYRPTALRAQGFTLLEILLVTVILATLVAIVTPRFRNTFDALRFKNYVLDLSATLHYARDKAILEKDIYRASFTENPAGYRLEKAAGSDFQPVKDRLGRFQALPPNISADVDAAQIVLYPDGSLTEARWVFKDANGHSMSLRTTADSGDMLVEDNE